jgi:DNA-binding CsgD family transcriptional regulator
MHTDPEPGSFTPRQREVLQLLASGITTNKAAGTYGTHKNHAP